MRDTILDLIESSLATGFSTSGRLPFDQNDTPLYLQNFKRIYVTYHRLNKTLYFKRWTVVVP